MTDKLRFNKDVLLGAWFVALALIGGLAAAAGPSASRVALWSKSDGLFITFGSLYAVGIAAAAILSVLLVHLRIGGLAGFFELGADGPAPTKPGHRGLAIAAYAAVALASCYFILVQPGGTLFCTMEHDGFVYYDGAQRLVHGQQQHVDFHTPMGLLCNLIPYWGLQLTGRFAGSMEMGSLLAGVYLLAAGSYVLGTRYTAALAVPLLLFFCLLVVVPLGIESSPDLISTAMFYNRLGWTSLAFAFLFFLEPRIPAPRRLPLDAVCLASLLLFGFYLKISYALVGLAFLPLLLFTTPYNRKLCLSTLAVFAAAVAGLELAYGFHAEYINDLRMSLSSSGANRGSMIPKFFANIREYLMALCVVALVYGSVRRMSRLTYLAFAGYVAASGLAIIDQNSHLRGVMGLLALFAVSQEILRRRIESSDGGDRKVLALKSAACLALVLFFVVQPIAYSTTAMAMIRSANVQIDPDLPGGLKGMVFNEHLREHLLSQVVDKRTRHALTNIAAPRDSQSEYLASLVDGVNILRDAGITQKRAMVLDFVSPFSFILALEPPTGDTTCIHYGRTMTDDSFTPPEELLGTVDYALVPLHPIDRLTTDFLVRTYGDYLDENFERIATSKHWVVWQRKAADEPANTVQRETQAGR